MKNPFDYQNNSSFVNLRAVNRNGRWQHYAIDFPIAFPGTFQESTTTCAEYFKPVKTGKAPLAILVHGWGDHSSFPLKAMARGLTHTGIHSVLLYIPFHSRRLPAEMKQRSPNLTPDEWFAGYRIGVTDIRQILDWAETVPEIDTRNVAVIGLSLGAFMGAIAMGVDERIKAGIFIVSGGNTGKIAQNSRFSKFRKRYRISPQEYERIQLQYARYLDDVALKGWQNVEPPDRSFLIDPLTYAYRLKGKPILMVNALWDELIPKEATLDFQHACGDCALVWFPATHASIWAFYPLISRRIHRFLGDSFKDALPVD